MEEKIYYLDNANTSLLSADVYRKILECYSRCQCDEHSLYFLGQNSAAEIMDAKIKVARGIFANPEEIIFTSGLEESNNWAIKEIGRASCRERV